MNDTYKWKELKEWVTKRITSLDNLVEVTTMPEEKERLIQRRLEFVNFRQKMDELEVE